MKKLLCLFLTAAMLLCMPGCRTAGGALFLLMAATGDDSADKDEVFAFVQENREALLRAIEDGDYSAFEHQGFIQEIDADEDVVDFSCGGAGVGPGTSYVGFYYTPDNDMTAVWCAPYSAQDLTPYGDGFEWWQEGSDNRYYTEKICDCFYYYEASF